MDETFISSPYTDYIIFEDDILPDLTPPPRGRPYAGSDSTSNTESASEFTDYEETLLLNYSGIYNAETLQRHKDELAKAVEHQVQHGKAPQETSQHSMTVTASTEWVASSDTSMQILPTVSETPMEREIPLPPHDSLAVSSLELSHLRAIFGSAHLHELWFPIELKLIPESDEVLSNFLIENLLPGSMERLFLPPAWLRLKTLLDRKRRSWSCPLCRIPRNRKMMQCGECNRWYHVCCVLAFKGFEVAEDCWVCSPCVKIMSSCAVLVEKVR